MRTHIELQDDLLEQVIQLGHFKTRKAAVNQALAEYVRLLKRRELLKLQGKLHWDADLDQLRQNRLAEEWLLIPASGSIFLIISLRCRLCV